MKDLVNLVPVARRARDARFYRCGHRRRSESDRHLKCQKCRGAGGYGRKRKAE